MGCNEYAASFKGTEKQLEDWFSRLQGDDRHENGNSYSGSIGMCQGLSIVRVPPFHKREEAVDLAELKAEKWGPAIAVPYLDTDGKTKWFVYGLCSS